MKPETYKRLFKKYKTAPVQGTYVSSSYYNLTRGKLECAACAVGLRIIHECKSIEDARSTMSDINRNLGFRQQAAKAACMSEDFCRGLDHGWEAWNGKGESCLPLADYEGSEEYLAGFNEGLFAAKACKPSYNMIDLLAKIDHQNEVAAY